MSSPISSWHFGKYEIPLATATNTKSRESKGQPSGQHFWGPPEKDTPIERPAAGSPLPRGSSPLCTAGPAPSWEALDIKQHGLCPDRFSADLGPWQVKP